MSQRQFQSAYRLDHSTEIALIKFRNDMLLFLSKSNISMLALLDFSSDTIDHSCLIHRLHADLYLLVLSSNSFYHV